MAVKINLHTSFAGQSYFGGNNAERYEEDFRANGIPVFERREIIRISQPAGVANLVFATVPAGKCRVCVRSGSGNLIWRSPLLMISTGNEEFNFTVISVPEGETTFSADQFEREIALPFVADIEGLDEDLVISKIDVAIKRQHIDIDGEGKLAKGSDWTILASDLQFDYDFEITPTESIDTELTVNIRPTSSLSLSMSNPITGFGLLFMQDQVNFMLKSTIRKIINAQIASQIQKGASDALGGEGSTEMVTATVSSCEIIQDGTTVSQPLPGGSTSAIPVNKLKMLVDISLPTELVTKNIAGGSKKGCLGIGIFAALVFGVLLYFGM